MGKRPSGSKGENEPTDQTPPDRTKSEGDTPNEGAPEPANSWKNGVDAGRAVTVWGRPSVDVLLPDGSRMKIDLGDPTSLCDDIIELAIMDWNPDTSYKAYVLYIEHSSGEEIILKPGDNCGPLFRGGIDAVTVRPQENPYGTSDPSECWYAGNMSKKQCEMAVKKAPHDTFLVRKKSSTVYVIYVNIMGALAKVNIKVTAHGYVFGKETFPSMHATLGAVRGLKVKGKKGKVELKLSQPAAGGIEFPDVDLVFTMKKEKRNSSDGKKKRGSKSKSADVEYAKVEERSDSDDAKERYARPQDATSGEHSYEYMSPLVQFAKKSTSRSDTSGSSFESKTSGASTSAYETVDVNDDDFDPEKRVVLRTKKRGKTGFTRSASMDPRMLAVKPEPPPRTSRVFEEDSLPYETPVLGSSNSGKKSQTPKKAAPIPYEQQLTVPYEEQLVDVDAENVAPVQ